MALTKAELEEQSREYERLLERARWAVSDGEFREAIEHAVACNPYVDGMMRYEEKRLGDALYGVGSIDLILEYGPLTLDLESLETTREFLRGTKRVDKRIERDLAQEVEDGIGRLWDAHRLWELIESREEVRQDELRRLLGGQQDAWRTLCEKWERMGLVRRAAEGGSYRVSFRTRLAAVTRARCMACGAVASAPKVDFLRDRKCEQCGATGPFVLQDDAAGHVVEGA